MKTGIKFSLCIFFFSQNILLVNAQRCDGFTIRDARPTFNIPSPHGSITASALLAENNLSKLETFSGCTIHIAAGINFEIDIPLALTEVTVIAGNGSGIKVNRKQTLVITYCKLISESDNHWNGISLEDNTAGLYLEHNEISNVLRGDEITTEKDERIDKAMLNPESSKNNHLNHKK